MTDTILKCPKGHVADKNKPTISVAVNESTIFLDGVICRDCNDVFLTRECTTESAGHAHEGKVPNENGCLFIARFKGFGYEPFCVIHASFDCIGTEAELTSNAVESLITSDKNCKLAPHRYADGSLSHKEWCNTHNTFKCDDKPKTCDCLDKVIEALNGVDLFDDFAFRLKQMVNK